MLFDLFRKERPASISVDELKEKLSQNDGSLFVDVRGKDEWDEGHIAGFQHIPLSELQLYKEKIENAPQIYLLCHSGGRSGMACAMLANRGHQRVFNIAGGISEWVARGNTIVT